MLRKKLFKLLTWVVLVSMAVSVVGMFSSCGNVEDKPQTDETTVGSDTTEAEDDVTPERYLYKHVVIVGVDGAGAFFKDADTPNLDAIFANGAVTYEAITETPSISAQCWGSMLHGVAPEVHTLTNASTGKITYSESSDFPSVFRVVREQMPDATLASFCHWSNINTGIIEDGIGVYKSNHSDDESVINAAAEYVKTAGDRGEEIPTLMFLQLDEADAAGHGEGYGGAFHLETITRLDGLIQTLYQAYVDTGAIEDTLFIVTTDHGGNGTGHGGDSEGEMKIMFAATGKTIVNGTVGEMLVRDIASITAYALGVEQPETWTSRVPSGLFDGVDATERPVYENIVYDRSHETVPTPVEGSDGYISSYITDKKLLHYLTFDGDVTDLCGGETSQSARLFYEDEGYFGQAASTKVGYASIHNYAPGTDSFSVSIWINTPGVKSDPLLFSNKNWSNGLDKGYAMIIDEDGLLHFNLADGNKRADMYANLPLNYKEGWMNVILIVDRDANVVKMAVDFGDFTTMTIPEAFKDMSFDSYDVLNIGNDGTGKYRPLFASIDEFMMFDGALTEAEVASLAAYYGK